MLSLQLTEQGEFNDTLTRVASVSVEFSDRLSLTLPCEQLVSPTLPAREATARFLSREA